MSEVPPPPGFPAAEFPAAGFPAADARATGFPAAGPAAEPVGDPAAGSPLAGGPGVSVRGPGGAGRGPGRRRRTRWRAAFFALAGVAVVAGVAWALLGNRVLVVRSVTVTGTHLLSPALVAAVADVPLGTPLMSVDAGAVTRRVEAIQQVASATVTEDWPDHVVIAVTERVPVMAVRMAAGGYDLVDKDGVIVRTAPAKPAALPLFATPLAGDALRGNPAVSAVTGVLAQLQPWLANQVTRVSAAAVPAGPEQVTLGLRDGKTIQWGSPGDAAQKNRELTILQGSSAREIDVSAPGTVVTKLPPGGMIPPGTPQVTGESLPRCPLAGAEPRDGTLRRRVRHWWLLFLSAFRGIAFLGSPERGESLLEGMGEASVIPVAARSPGRARDGGWGAGCVCGGCRQRTASDDTRHWPRG